MTIQNVELSNNEKALIAAVNIVAAAPFFKPASDLPKDDLTKNQRATNEAIATAQAIVANNNFVKDPETVVMRTLAILNSSARELVKLNESFGYLSAYILCRRITHQSTYMAITAKKDAQRYEQQLLRSNVSNETRSFIAADDWATEFVTTEAAATAEQLLLAPEDETPRTRAEQSVEGADYVFNLLKRPMDSFCSMLMQFEKDLAAYLSSVGTDYTIRVFLHSYTSVAMSQGKETVYQEALSFDEAESLLALKAAKKIESRANDMEAIFATRNKALRAL